ncbi:WD repeat-containing protein 76 [Capsaspora owczarzaki ATCC 30864]|nr:WD repeat-containing protein 76 [Capsaspora owczarzaki ATCC 30864]|eukprot:XP_004365342.1 WD repeat-containing protein 76 [Capsaspora owczarzaki ATCC 30864]
MVKRTLSEPPETASPDLKRVRESSASIDPDDAASEQDNGDDMTEQQQQSPWRENQDNAALAGASRGSVLSDYERQRLDNVRKNHAMLAALQLTTARSDLGLTASAGKSSPSPSIIKGSASASLARRKAQQEPNTNTPTRRSARLAIAADPTSAQAAERVPVEPALSEEHFRHRWASSMLPARSLNVPASIGRAILDELAVYQSTPPPVRSGKAASSIVQTYSSLRMGFHRLAKVVPDRIMHVRFHPMHSRLIAAAGDYWGRVAFWDVDYPWSGSTKPTSSVSSSSADSEVAEAESQAERAPLRLRNPGELLQSQAQESTLPSPTISQAVSGSGGDDEEEEDAPNEGIYVFQPHQKSVSSIAFLGSGGSTMITASYDGTVRRLDMASEHFDEVFALDWEDDDHTIQYLDPHPSQNGTFLGCSSDGSGFLIDTRASAGSGLPSPNRRSTSRQVESAAAELSSPFRTYKPVWQHTLHTKKANTIQFNPANSNYFVTSGVDAAVRIWDVRKLSGKKASALLALDESRLSVTSAFFSPHGDRLLTTSLDHHLRIYNNVQLVAPAQQPACHELAHNNQTGRWLSTFHAVWDPKHNDTFVCGSMDHPRQIEVFHLAEKTGLASRVVSLQDEYLGSVMSRLAVHPSRDAVMGGNSSGRAVVFAS